MTQPISQPDLKIIFLGAGFVGKTSIMRQYTEGKFEEGDDKPTIGASFLLKKWCNKTFVIWDTAGQERFDSLNTFYCRNTSAAILVFDLTAADSFKALPKYYDMVHESSPNAYLVVVGSKYDLVAEKPQMRAVSQEEAQEYAKQIKAAYIEASAKINYNITEIFDLIGQHYYPDIDPDKYRDTSNPQPSPQPSRPAPMTVSTGQYSVVVRPDQVLSPPPQQQSGCAC